MSQTDAPIATDAVNLKRFFKQHFGIPVRVQTSSGRAGYIQVRIPPAKREPGEGFHAPLRYSHTFPVPLGVACVLAVYGNLVGNTPERPWCGNVSPTMIVLKREQWESVLAQVVAGQLPS